MSDMDMDMLTDDNGEMTSGLRINNVTSSAEKPIKLGSLVTLG